MIYLGAEKTAQQSGGQEGEQTKEEAIKQIGELSVQQRKQLRQARFGNGQAVPGLSAASTTVEAFHKMEELNKKRQERAERFGIVTKEIKEKRIKERQERFGIVTKEMIEAKKQERMKRFATPPDLEDTSKAGMTAEELEAKRKARLERFGQAEVEQAQKEVGQGVRRKVKMLHKKGKRTIDLTEGEN